MILGFVEAFFGLLLDDLSSLICFLNSCVAGPEVVFITSESSSSLLFFLEVFFTGATGCYVFTLFNSCLRL